MSFPDRIVAAGSAALTAAVDAWGTFAKPRPAERLEDVAPALYDDRASVYGSSASPEAVTEALYARNSGYLAGWHDLADHALRTSPHMATCLITLCDSVVETDFKAMPGAGRRTVAAGKAADAVNELITTWRRTELDTWVAQMVAARYYVAGLHEVVWARDGRVVAPVALRHVAERRLSYSSSSADARPWELRITGEVNGRTLDPWSGVPVSDFHPDKFLIHEPHTLGGHRASEGLFAGIVWYWLFGVISWRDLMRLQEMLGRPPVLAYYATGDRLAQTGSGTGFPGVRAANAEERALARRVVESMTSSLRAALPDTVRLEKLPVEIPSQPLQILTSDRCHALMSKLFLGTTGVVDIVPGSRASQQTAFEQSHTGWRSNCRFVARQMTEIGRRYIRANPDFFGEDCPLPEVVAQTAVEQTPLEAAAEINATLGTGLSLEKAWMYKVLKKPMPAEGAEVVQGVYTPRAMGA